MCKRVIIVHGWEGYPEEGWFPWLKTSLEKKGFDVVIPLMPNAKEPKIDVWVSYLAKIVGRPGKDTFLVGHSIGCQTILRYLEDIKGIEKVGGVVLVAGFLDLMNLSDEERKIAEPWLVSKIDLKKVKNHISNITTIFSDNDTWVSLTNSEIFEKELDAKVIVLKNKGHFSGSDGVNKLPVVLHEILEFSKD